MSREEIMIWLDHLANRETVPECKEALETASWIIYGCPEDIVESYSVIAAKPALTRVLLAEGKSLEEVKRLLNLKEKGDGILATYEALSVAKRIKDNNIIRDCGEENE